MYVSVCFSTIAYLHVSPTVLVLLTQIIFRSLGPDKDFISFFIIIQTVSAGVRLTDCRCVK